MGDKNWTVWFDNAMNEFLTGPRQAETPELVMGGVLLLIGEMQARQLEVLDEINSKLDAFVMAIPAPEGSVH